MSSRCSRGASSRCVAVVLVSVWACFADRALAEELQEASKSSGVSMRIVEPVDLLVGEHAVFRVELTNESTERIRLIRPLYDSLGHRRYPRISIDVADANGKSVRLDRRPGPKKQDELYESSFIVFGPGEKARFEVRWPYVQDGLEPGRYRVRVEYDTRAPDLEAWAAWPPDDLSAPDNPVGRREMSAWLEQVRPVRLVAESTVTVHDLTSSVFRAMLLASTRSPELRAQLDAAFESGDFAIESTRRIRGAVLVTMARRGAAEGLGDAAYIVQPAVLRPGTLQPFEGFQGSSFHVDPLASVPLWRRKQLGLPPAGR